MNNRQHFVLSYKNQKKREISTRFKKINNQNQYNQYKPMPKNWQGSMFVSGFL